MTLQIWKQISPIDLRRPFRIVELFPTCDGLRSRLTHRAFETLEEASKWVHDRQAQVDFTKGAPDGQ